MKLDKNDRELLKEMGCSEEDFKQIEEVSSARNTTYELIDEKSNQAKEIIRAEAIRLLGRRQYLAGLSRSAFHWSAVQDVPDGSGRVIYFDSSKYFKS